MKKSFVRLSFKQSFIALSVLFSTFVPLTSHAVIQNSFSYQYAMDPKVNVPIMKVFLPQGWRINVTSDWQRCSSASIALGIVSLISPDGATEIVFTTPEAYHWSTTKLTKQMGHIPINNQGCNFPKRMFNLPYKSPKEYIKMILQAWGMSSQQSLAVNMSKEDALFKKMLKPKMTQQAQLGVNAIVQNSRGVYANGTVSGVDASVGASQELVVLKNGAHRYSEHIVATSGYSTRLTGRQVTRQLPPSIQDNTIWRAQVISYYAPTVEAFNANYDLYRMVVNNSQFMPQWGYLCDHFGMRMALAVMRGTDLGRAQASAQAAKEALQKATEQEKTADQSQMTEAMSDVIYERNDYTDHEGNHFKVNTGYDVYRDQDNKYHIVQEGHSMPYNYEKLKPNSAKDY
ncbi:hypothetical protein SAMN02910357_02456 [Succinivibrio dextrinosolvens]|uniref:hypothetical protein n=1 Tax=Succinivibrio dextrinosolvens TaxID=83771 RepID=UPI0008E49091|nr:hypothetical protein [Succinivibrio dextrinosolvens]SFS89708.1 hypothetical protein SAMN02910357_02456 [Succinivibrio dextrinosolvens]